MTKLALGTVQFGIDYGISNRIGRTQKSDVDKILKYAFKKGINTLDTALSYGNSERVVGDSIRSTDCWDIITKTMNFTVDTISNKQIDELLYRFELSRKKLGQEVIYGLLIHNCDNLFLPGGGGLLQALEALKNEGFIKKVGVSIYNGKQVDRILNNYSVDLVQIPISILDQRLLKSGRLKKLKKHGIEIHARSIFLQGLILMLAKDVPYWFNPILGVLKEFCMEAEKRNMSTLQLALGFVQSIDEIDKIVVGVNTLKQLREIIDSTSICVNTTEFSNISINDPIFLNPSNWKV